MHHPAAAEMVEFKLLFHFSKDRFGPGRGITHLLDSLWSDLVMLNPLTTSPGVPLDSGVRKRQVSQ